MKIYFAGSIRGIRGREDQVLYRQLIDYLGRFGEVLTEHVGLVTKGEDSLPDRRIHDRDMRWLVSSRVVVAEVTRPSLGAGYKKRWKENVSPDVIRSDLFELYTGGLEKHGLKAVPKLIYAESTNSPLYYLMYAVRFPVGEKVWKAVAKPRISKYVTLDGSEVTIYE